MTNNEWMSSHCGRNWSFWAVFLATCRALQWSINGESIEMAFSANLHLKDRLLRITIE